MARTLQFRTVVDSNVRNAIVQVKSHNIIAKTIRMRNSCSSPDFFFSTHSCIEQLLLFLYTDTSLYEIETLPSYTGWKGEDAALSCEFSGNFSRVCWKKETEVVRCHSDTISGASRFRLDDDFGLVITDLQVLDEANFTCQVTRMDGTMISNVTLLVVNGNFYYNIL